MKGQGFVNLCLTGIWAEGKKNKILDSMCNWKSMVVNVAHDMTPGCDDDESNLETPEKLGV